LRELDDKNPADAKVKEKIVTFCRNPQKVRITRTALNDIGLLGLNKNGVLELVIEHIESKRRVFTDRMDNGDTAYIITECFFQDGVVLYVKVKFVKQEIDGKQGVEKLKREADELMVLISSHPPRKW
jgi:hypothetical protein